MVKQIKFHFLHTLFRLCAYCADKSGGWRVFVKPKMLLGTLMVGVGLVVAQNQAGQPLTNKKESSPKQPILKGVTTQTNVTSDQNVLCYYIAEEMPQFPGGDVAAYIARNLCYPESCYKKEIQGRVICQFVVEKDGRLTDVQVVRGVHPDLNKEAVRIIYSMPKWIPGQQRNQVVRVKYTLPVNFKINKEAVVDTTVYAEAEKMPEFPNDSLFHYLGKETGKVMYNLYKNYQHVTVFSERVVCQFIVEKDGSITHVKVIRGVCPEYDNESIRILQNMPKWVPGEQNGKKVRVRYTLPINFRLQ